MGYWGVSDAMSLNSEEGEDGWTEERRRKQVEELSLWDTNTYHVRHL